MFRDKRPIFEQVKSGFKIAGILIVVCASLLVLFQLLPIYRIQALLWHWKHGNSIQVGEFMVPVPNEWRVDRFESGTTVLLVNTKGSRHSWATITISDESFRRTAILTDLASTRRQMMENLGIHVTDYRQVIIGGLPGFCLEGETSMMGMPVREIACYSGTGFSLEYVGGSLKAPSFYPMLEGISRVSKQ